MWVWRGAIARFTPPPWIRQCKLVSCQLCTRPYLVSQAAQAFLFTIDLLVVAGGTFRAWSGYEDPPLTRPEIAPADAAVDLVLSQIPGNINRTCAVHLHWSSTCCLGRC